jgi:hypothetical protein
MPTTEYNVSMIRNAVPNYSRQQILESLDEIQKIVYAQDSEQTLYTDPTTGMPPYLATVAGTYDYACPANCRRTACVFSEQPNFGSRRPSGDQDSYYFRGTGYYKVMVSSTDAQPNGTVARVMFRDDPGTTTAKFFHAYWVTVPELSTEEDQLSIPDHLHWRLRKGVLSLLTDEEYGDTGQGEGTIERICRKIRSQLNRGAQSMTGLTPVQEQDRTYVDGHYDSRF